MVNGDGGMDRELVFIEQQMQMWFKLALQSAVSLRQRK